MHQNYASSHRGNDLFDRRESIKFLFNDAVPIIRNTIGLLLPQNSHNLPRDNITPILNKCLGKPLMMFVQIKFMSAWVLCIWSRLTLQSASRGDYMLSNFFHFP